MNAYEEGDEVVLDGYFQEDPQPPPLEGYAPKLGQMMAYLDEHSHEAQALSLALQPEDRRGDARACSTTASWSSARSTALAGAQGPLPLFDDRRSPAGSCSPASSSTTWRPARRRRVSFGEDRYG